MKILQFIELLKKLINAISGKGGIVLLFLYFNTEAQSNSMFWMSGSYQKSKIYLLDKYQEAEAAYSLRKLSGNYTGPAIQIITTSQGTNQPEGSILNIGFDDDGNLDQTAIINHCLGTTCTVQTWYDQSGNENNATQATIANQPIIYTGDEIVHENNKPAISFIQSNEHSLLSGSNTVNVSTSNTIFSVVKRLPSATGFFSGPYKFKYMAADIYENTSELYILSNSGYTPGNTVLNSQILETINYSTSSYYYRNSSFIGSGNAGTTAGTYDYKIGVSYNAPGQSYIYNGTIQEIIFYNTDKSNDREGIEININSYYNIY